MNMSSGILIFRQLSLHLLRIFVALLGFQFLVSCGSSLFQMNKGNVKVKSDNSSVEEVSNDVLVDISALKVRVFLEGLFDTGSGQLKRILNTNDLIPTNHPFQAGLFNHSGSETISLNYLDTYPEIVDWIHIELRSDLASSSKVISKSVLIDEDGYLRDLDGNDSISFSGVSAGEYYVIIRHRNHLPIISTARVMVKDSSETPELLDFTSNLNSCLPGKNNVQIMKEVDSGIWAMLVGDANQDGKISYSTDSDADSLGIYIFSNPANISAMSSFPYVGYSSFDLNYDGQAVYQGAGTDITPITINIFVHPDNPTFDANFVIEMNENI